jgi:TPR repeat protein
MSFFQRAADKQNSLSEMNFGFCLLEGVGADRDSLSSVKYFKSAANKGDRIGRFNCGLFCHKGENIPVD